MIGMDRAPRSSLSCSSSPSNRTEASAGKSPGSEGVTAMNGPIYQQRITVNNPRGLHLRDRKSVV